LRAAPAGAGIALALLVAAGGARAADVCPPAGGPAAGPLAGGTGPADFGAIPEACPVGDATLRLRGALLVAAGMPDYFGSIISDAMLRARRRVSARGWLSLALDVVDFRYINNGGLASTGFAFGPATLGYYQTVYATPSTTTAAYARALLPVDTARQNGTETGLELGGSLRVPVGTRAVADGGLALTAPLDITAGQLHGRLEPVLLAEAWLALNPTVALGGGASAKAELAPTATFLTVVPRLSGRWALPHRIWLALLLEVPVAGTDRTDFVGSLFGGLAL
jgi:hypothetical protein